MKEIPAELLKQIQNQAAELYPYINNEEKKNYNYDQTIKRLQFIKGAKFALSLSGERKEVSEVDLDNEFRMIISHAFLGEDQNISKDGFNLAIGGCVKYVKQLFGNVNEAGNKTEKAGTQTAEEIYEFHIGSRHEKQAKDILIAMEEYAEQYRNQDGWISVEELMKAYKDYILFLENESNRYVQFAGVHGMSIPSDVFLRGQALRNEISKFEILLHSDKNK